MKQFLLKLDSPIPYYWDGKHWVRDGLDKAKRFRLEHEAAVLAQQLHRATVIEVEQ